MCGIVGLLELTGGVADLEMVRSMASVLAYRGPDGQGVWCSGPVALGHRRLSIIDLSERALQPMSNHDGTAYIVFNGEIYNFKELRETLEAAGYAFRSRSDTEVLLCGYKKWGLEGLLERLIGIFAFGLWDERAQSLFLVRDHLGVKPLYYAEYNGKLLFASEMKAFYAAGLPFSMEPESGAELLVFGHVAGTQTPVRGVRRLEPGTYSLWQPGSHGTIRTVEYWNLFEKTKNRTTSSETEIEALLRDAARLQQVSDVSLGTLCSGGVDSSLLTALLSESSHDPIHTFCVVYDEPGVLNEGPYAQAVSEMLNTHHHETLADAEAFVSNINQLSWANDEPIAHLNDVMLYLVARDARSHVTVLWSGEGGDELFGGYVRYCVPSWYQSYRFLLKPLLSAALRLPRIRDHRRFTKMNSFMQMSTIENVIVFNQTSTDLHEWEQLSLKLDGNFQYRRDVYRETTMVTKNATEQVMLYDQKTHLVSLLNRNDKMTMHASIECRVPFLDHRLVVAANRLPLRFKRARGKTKRILYNRFRRSLPSCVWDRAKWGFGVPIEKWLRETPALVNQLRSLHKSPLVDYLKLNGKGIQEIVARFFYDGTNGDLIQRLLMTTIWLEVTDKKAREVSGHSRIAS
jgi:asparagine synthase (glutamine-hydrolysing)